MRWGQSRHVGGNGLLQAEQGNLSFLYFDVEKHGDPLPDSGFPEVTGLVPGAASSSEAGEAEGRRVWGTARAGTATAGSGSGEGRVLWTMNSVRGSQPTIFLESRDVEDLQGRLNSRLEPSHSHECLLKERKN